MAKLFFVAGRLFKVNIVEVFGHLVYLALLYGEAEFFLCLCELEPEPPPRAEFFLRPEKFGHFF
jgi:hypothetical protein